jgi:hypothetical protein
MINARTVIIRTDSEIFFFFDLEKASFRRSHPERLFGASVGGGSTGDSLMVSSESKYSSESDAVEVVSRVESSYHSSSAVSWDDDGMEAGTGVGPRQEPLQALRDPFKGAKMIKFD